MLTVLMATYNGADTLPTVLGAYCQLESPAGGWKLVVVDNGSTDSTKDTIGTFAPRLPLRYVFEPQRGKNAALNTGLAYLEGDLIILTDDDAVPRADWLTQLRAVADSRPDFSVFGGTVLPQWEVEPESWITNLVQLIPVFALTDPSWEEGPTNPRRVFGLNSAYRASIFEAGFRFDTSIGPAGPSYAMGSETELNLRLAKAGFSAWHCKHAEVRHLIRKEQMTRKWILRRAFRFGRGFYRLEMKDTIGSPTRVLGIPRYFFREIIEQMRRSAGARLKRDSAAAFQESWELYVLLGRAYEARLLYRTAKLLGGAPNRKPGATSVSSCGK